MLGGKFELIQNVTYTLRDKDGNIKPLFQENKLARFLLDRGILSPRLSAVPFLFGNYAQFKNIHNLVVSAGKAGMASRANGSGAEAAFVYIAVGTGSSGPAAGDTTLGTETSTSGLSRVSASVSRVTTSVTNDTAQLTTTFSVSGTVAVTEAGVLNAASVGTLLARQVFSAINVVNTDSLTITWKFQFS